MSKNVLLSVFLIGMVAGSFGLLTSHLASQDTSISSYLSGLMLDFTGNQGENQLIRVNLHNGSIAMYENGQLYRMGQIAGAGNPSNSTATPTGSFRILSKETSHKSRLSGVIMPWAMRFFEGYYFHDIPLTPTGVRIDTKYSHGCIRLSSMMAHEVYDWTRVGAYVEVYRARLVKDALTPTIYYLTTDGYRQPIADEQTFIRRGFKWSDVVTIPSDELVGLPLAQMLN